MKMKIPFSPPDVGEEEINEVIDTLKSGWLTTGPKTKKLEEQIAEYCHTNRAVCLNSATACLEMTLRLFGIGPGDEVITSAYTYTASASVICHVGATPVLVDTAENSFFIDYKKLEDAITERTKAVIPVDVAGVLCDYDKIIEIVNRKKQLFHVDSEWQKALGRVLILADSSHAFGAQKNNKMCGEFADFTCFSFHAVKNFTTVEGGSVVWRDVEGLNNDEIYKQYMLISLHGQSKDALAKTKLGGWEYDILSTAYKCNLTDVMSSIGLVQMKRYPQLLKIRHERIEQYEKGIQKINRLLKENQKEFYLETLKHKSENSISSGHLYLMRIIGKAEETRNDVIIKMAEEGIATNVHYKPLPLLTAYKNLGFCMSDFENAYNMYKNEITLPLYSLLTEEQAAYVLDNLERILLSINE